MSGLQVVEEVVVGKRSMSGRNVARVFCAVTLLAGSGTAVAQQCAPEPGPINRLTDVIDRARDGSPAASCVQSFGDVSIPAAQQILKHINPTGSVSVIPVVFYTGNTVARFPVYRVLGSDGIIVWIDPAGRVYSTWDDWKQNNQLPEGTIVAPPYGTLFGNGCNGEAEAFRSVADDLGHKLAGALDGVATVAGIALSGAALVAVVVGSGGTALLVGGAVLGAYGAVRATSTISDRQTHDQTLDPNDPGARAAWLQLAASGLTVASAGSAVTGMLGPEAANGLGTASLLLGGAAVGDGAVQLAQHWGTMSEAERQAAASQLLFGGISALGGAIDPVSGKPVFVPPR